MLTNITYGLIISSLKIFEKKWLSFFKNPAEIIALERFWLILNVLDITHKLHKL